MAAKLVTLQGEQGYWPVSLLVPQKTPETSGTGFFVYGLAWGINHGVLPAPQYRPAVERGWRALKAAVSRTENSAGCSEWAPRPTRSAPRHPTLRRGSVPAGGQRGIQMQIDLQDTQKLYQKIALAIAATITDGRYGPGRKSCRPSASWRTSSASADRPSVTR